ncbi:calcium/calmodulin-dependent protein kinase type II alpha chain-like [Dendronephthya gigantea]|uniref:calcium/calmodulin-dependent protein kinase type II alpha chain-like n=1 Tax=Dendronephthya gigantea TaxID=151771 RepID=UPI00106D76C4|nr:calcium/calmodulin-dependent protein kinase type II alpha chain-like [Dendronephthya gigantea]
MDVYEFKEELGRGSFGVVRKCLDRKSQKVLAVKEINLELAGQNKDVITNEIQICKKLQHHERIVRLEDVIYRDNLVYLVFEYLSGGDLFDGILARNWYSEKQSCLLAKQILQALGHCHRLRVIHRDLKPENILLCRRYAKDEVPHLKLTDFGVACEVPGKISVHFLNISDSNCNKTSI